MLTLAYNLVILYLFVLNPADDNLSISKHVMLVYSHNKLILTILSVLFLLDSDGSKSPLILRFIFIV
jgi:hypothetical protein